MLMVPSIIDYYPLSFKALNLLYSILRSKHGTTAASNKKMEAVYTTTKTSMSNLHG